MNLEEMIQHLYIAESILEHMAEIANFESETGKGYFSAAENIGDLIVDLERLDSSLKQMTEAAKPAEQPAPTEPTDKGFTLPPYSFPPWQKTITTPNTTQRPYVGDIPNPPITVTYTESQIEDQQARH